MSYILEALKKAEKERGHRTAPDSPPVPGRALSGPEKRSPWVYLVLTIMLLNAGGLLIWTRPWQPQETAPPSHRETKQQVAQGTDNAAAALKGRAATAGALMQATTENEQDHNKATAGFPVVPSLPVQDPLTRRSSAQYPPSARGFASQKVPALHELPQSVQSAIPEITISGHYYDTDPSSRVATVNGRVMHEGQTLSEGLKIEQIMPSGVVFSYRGYRFHKGVF